MIPIRAFVSNVPEGRKEIPGVWQNRKGGFRVPINAYSLVMGEERDHEEDNSYLFDADFWKQPSYMPTFLTEYQKDAILWTTQREGSHVWAPPGAGKTLIGVAWLAHAQRGAKLVVTRASARDVWYSEIKRFTRFKPVMLTGQTATQVKWSPRNIYITGYETLAYWMLKLSGVHSVVYDEVHCAKAWKRAKGVIQPDGSTRWTPLPNISQSCAKLGKFASRRIGLTATPIPNRVRDLWSQCDVIEPWQWGSFMDFAKRYCNARRGEYGWVTDGSSRQDELKERLDRIAYRVSQPQVSQHLPPLRRERVYLSRAAQNRGSAMTRVIKKAAKTARSTGDKSTFHEALLMEAASKKRKYVVERAVDAALVGQKVVVFTGRKKEVDAIAKEIAKTKGLRFWAAHGDTPVTQRGEIREAYMSHPNDRTYGGCILVGTGHAFGESINLQDTDLAIMAMLPWVPRHLRQWEGRFPRLGQVRPVLISYVIAEGTFDEHISEVVLDKLPPVGTLAEDQVADEINEVLSSVIEGEDLLSAILG